MPSLQIRDLPPDVYEQLAYRAQSEGRSLAQQALIELRQAQPRAGQDRRRAILARLASRKAPAGDAWPPPEELIRQDRSR